jgi:RHS repeat-associated protein
LTFSIDFKFNERLTYDLRGNILSLQRNGFKLPAFSANDYAAANYGLIDNLAYTYNNQNQVTKITDVAMADKGFKFANTGNSTDYEYDDNGNLVKDLNKGITNIRYNYLNLPEVIQFGSGRGVKYLKFVYDATGVKLRKITREDDNGGGVSEQKTDYVNGIEYKNGVINRIAHSEGAVTLQDNGMYVHEFVLRDHLGNTRVTFSDPDGDGTVTQADIKQINHYYPFGLNMEGNWNGAAGANKYQYNGKEWNDDFGLGWNDYGKRMYDPAIARWVSIDILAERYNRWSAYNYTLNNPIKYIDPDGTDGMVTFHQGKGTKDDPNVITIKANYYYDKNSMSKDEIAALDASIAEYNNTSKESGSSKKGTLTVIKYELSATGKNSEQEAKDAALGDTYTGKESGEARQFGNFIGRTNNPKSDDVASDYGGKRILLNDATLSKAKETGYDMAKLLVSTFKHEIGHNLGGEHIDPDPMGAHISLSYRQKDPNCIGGGCEQTPITEEKSVSRNFGPILINRIDNPVGRRYLEHQKQD